MICTEITFDAIIYIDETHAEAKLLKQQLFEYFCIYLNVGAQWWNSVWTVSFEFTTATTNFVTSDLAWPSIFFWEKRFF